MEYDPTDWSTQIDPYPTYAQLRDGAPVYHNEKMGFWALSRFEDVWDAHLDWETFSSAWGQTLEKTLTPLPLMISLDPPKHTRVRQLVSKVFTPRRVGLLEPIVRGITTERLDGLERGGPSRWTDPGEEASDRAHADRRRHVFDRGRGREARDREADQQRRQQA